MDAGRVAEMMSLAIFTGDLNLLQRLIKVRPWQFSQGPQSAAASHQVVAPGLMPLSIGLG